MCGLDNVESFAYPSLSWSSCDEIRVAGGIHCWSINGHVVRASKTEMQAPGARSSTSAKAAVDSENAAHHEQELPSSTRVDGKDTHESRCRSPRRCGRSQHDKQMMIRSRRTLTPTAAAVCATGYFHDRVLDSHQFHPCVRFLCTIEARALFYHCKRRWFTRACLFCLSDSDVVQKIIT